MPRNVSEEIRRTLDEKAIVLFMKGTREVPSCGYSAVVVEILTRLGTEYEAIDVSRDAELREGVEAYAGWPSFPQLFVRGHLLGGVDLVRELDRTGELQGLLAAPVVAAPPSA